MITHCASLMQRESDLRVFNDRNQRRIQYRLTGRAFGFDFQNVDDLIRIYFNCSQHAMYAVCILFYTLTTKPRVCMKEIQNNPQKQIILPRRPPPPFPDFEIPIRHSEWIFYKYTEDCENIQYPLEHLFNIMFLYGLIIFILNNSVVQ